MYVNIFLLFIGHLLAQRKYVGFIAVTVRSGVSFLEPPEMSAFDQVRVGESPTG
jgi:hypothetical protein